MLKLTCSECSNDIKITSREVHEASEIEGCTFDCAHCGALLVMNQGEVKSLHKMLSVECPGWPADGAGTGFIEMGALDENQ